LQRHSHLKNKRMPKVWSSNLLSYTDVGLTPWGDLTQRCALSCEQQPRLRRKRTFGKG